jgi:3-oxoacyl-[acyl-carrier-protein] synthase II
VGVDSGTDDVWITGVGAATPLGNDFPTVAANLLAGRSGIAPVTGFPVTDHPSRIAARVGAIPCPPGRDAEAFGRLRPLEQVALWCCDSALRDAGWWDRRGSLRVGLVLGLGAEWLVTWEGDGLRTGSALPVDPSGTEPLVETVRRELGLSGPAVGLSAACASCNHALAQARRWLQLGWVDVCLAGACDMSVTPMALACFGNLRTLSRRNDEPASASRPFDRGRDGFVIGEGGAAFVREPAARARRRRARAYAAVVGFGASSDAYHPVIPNPDTAPAAAAITQALADAGVSPDEVSYVNAHAPGTPLGDVLEAGALARALGDAAPRVPVSSTKSMTGHLLAAAAAVECLACLAAFEHRALPPTINLDDPDPECGGLDHVRHEARPGAVRIALSNSFGFGGSNTCLALRAVAGG